MAVNPPAWRPDYTPGSPNAPTTILRGARIGHDATVASGELKSANYVAATSGWAIKADGTVEFSDGDFRGDIEGAAITGSSLTTASSGSRIEVGLTANVIDFYFTTIHTGRLQSASGAVLLGYNDASAGNASIKLDNAGAVTLQAGTGGLIYAQGAAGISYQSITHGSAGTAATIGFTWTSPNLFGHVNDSNTITIGTASDRRLKTNIETLDPKLSRHRILNYRPISYDAVETDGTPVFRSARLSGLVADEAELVDPTVVVGERGENSYQSLNYAGIIPDLINVCAELIERISALEEQQ